MTETNLALLPVMLPLAGAVFGLAAKSIHRPRVSAALEWAAAGIGLFAPLAVLVFLLPGVLSGGITYAVGSRGASLGIIQRFDGLSWLLDGMAFSALAIAWIYTRGAGPRGGLFTTLFLIQAAALAASASCADLFNLFVCFEVLGIASYALVASSEKPKAFLASFNYLGISSAAMTFFLLGVFGFYRLTGALSYEGIIRGLALLPDGGGAPAVLSLACIAAATLVRVAVMPLSGWLPDAHASAPHGVSAVLSGVLLKTPLFALGRFLWDFLAAPDRVFLPLASLFSLLGILGALTAVAGVVLALSQRDAKRLLAYHSISQIGYVMSAWALATPAGFAAAFLHAFAHSVFKSLLFISVGTAADAGGTRDVYKLRGAAAALKKAGDSRGITAVCFAVGALAIAAIPPLNGFASKQAVVYRFSPGQWQYWMLTIAGIGTMASMIKLGRIFFGKRTAGQGGAGDHGGPAYEAPAGTAEFTVKPAMKTAMLAWAVLCIVFGIGAVPFGAFVGNLFNTEYNPVPAGLLSLSSLGNTVLYAAGGFLLYRAAASGPGKSLCRRIREVPRSFQQLVFAFSLALLLIAGAMLFT
ncbi:complex I subunit 5 family protein [Breznakiella homolactica]|uniref:NADH:quinone oxidoreductase/Mrp antiporter transmembrane domain-containing protein n=1 Tax=Breznakiella homolactica TaxID=2798577 RepID=A0A7T8BD86_9SPIR|nr:proton-conducting transporter membrane subunit [Breznakiella homolactica]QQO10998.1 hypothetical protein JFL75_08790 [Breznakiella homolactica]